MESKTDLMSVLRGMKGKGFLAVLLIAGVALLVLGGHDTKGGDYDYNAAAEEYRVALESRLCELCTAIDGAGRASVMVTLDGGEYYVYAADTSSSGSVDFAISSGKGLLLETKMPAVRGVAVVCEGGANDRVRKEMTLMLAALLDLPSSKICVTAGAVN